MSYQDFVTIAPLVAAVLTAAAVLIVDLIRPGRSAPATATALIGLGLTAIVTLAVGGSEATAFGGTYTVDPLTTFLDVLFIAVVAMTIMFAPDYLLPRNLPVAEFATVLIFAMSGAMLLAGSTDLLLLFLGLELMVLPGYLLAGLMKNPDDTVVLEPLGFIGLAAFNRTVYDFPGLGSKVAVAAVKNLSPPRIAGLVHALQPTYAVLRPNEFADLMRRFPETAAKYELAARMRSGPGLTLRNMGYSYRVIDNDFQILRRTRDFDQVVHP